MPAGSSVSRSGTSGSSLSTILMQGRAPGAKITRPKVAGPSRGDYGTPGPRPTIALPNRSDFGTPNDEGIGGAASAASRARRGFNNPTGTAAFGNLMNLAQEQTASAEAEIGREAKDAASRAGYSGGFGSRARAAGSDRLHALAEAGFAGAAKIREEELGMYNTAQGSLTDLITSRNAQMGESNRAFGGALASAHEAQGGLDLGFSKLVQERDLSYAEAKGEAQRLQAQLDQAFNGSLIDNARYEQMSTSLAAQLESEKMRLAEGKRQFNMTREDSLVEAARGRKERGVDPITGEKYGPARPALDNSIDDFLRFERRRA